MHACSEEHYLCVMLEQRGNILPDIDITTQILEAIVLKEKSQAFLLQRLSTPIYSGRASYVDHHHHQQQQQLESPIVKNTVYRSNYLKYVQYCDCSALGNSNSNKNQQLSFNNLQIDLSMPEYIKSFKVSVDMLTLKVSQYVSRECVHSYCLS